jgi:outer membrane protein assembly factor BamB
LPLKAGRILVRAYGLFAAVFDYASDLSDPAKVGTLTPVWWFPPTSNGVGEFKTSPIVVDDTVFIGSVNGYFYALDAATGTKKWQYPKAGGKALLGSCDPGGFAGGIGHYGIQSSATFAVIGGQRAVIFGAPDPTAPPFDPMGNGWGSCLVPRCAGTDLS